MDGGVVRELPELIVYLDRELAGRDDDKSLGGLDSGVDLALRRVLQQVLQNRQNEGGLGWEDKERRKQLRIFLNLVFLFKDEFGNVQ